MSGVLTEVDVLEVARIVEGEEETGDNFGDQDDDWSWEGIKAVGSRYLPRGTSSFRRGRSVSS